MIGLKPQIGRTYTEEEENRAAPARSDQRCLWERAFHRDPAVLGRAITLHNQPFTVIGVMPPEMNSPAASISGCPSSADVPGWRTANHPGLFAWGQLKPGVTVEQARSQMRDRSPHRETHHPTNAGIGVTVRPCLKTVLDRIRKTWDCCWAQSPWFCSSPAPTSRIFSPCVGPPAPVNSRFAAALGAGRGQIIRQLLIESMLIALLGGVIGFLIAFWARSHRRVSPGSAAAATGRARWLGPRFHHGFAFGTNFLFGLWPARLWPRADVGLP